MSEEKLLRKIESLERLLVEQAKRADEAGAEADQQKERRVEANKMLAAAQARVAEARKGGKE